MAADTSIVVLGQGQRRWWIRYMSRGDAQAYGSKRGDGRSQNRMCLRNIDVKEGSDDGIIFDKPP